MNIQQGCRTASTLLPILIAIGGLVTSGMACARPARATPPNILLIMTDDQGYGDLGVHGNPRIKTPNLDRLAKESVRLKNFFACPVCSPTRASLMTGRYNYRTGVVDTYIGRSLMYPDETTTAEILKAGGYKTGIFGKWHLGDNYPLRAIDQGFQEALIIKGGGLAQPSDPAGSEGYFNPILMANGRERRCPGYCSDIYTDAAIEFIRAAGDSPFFTYLAFNAPHSPLQVPAKDLEAYDGIDLSNAAFPKIGNPLPGLGMPKVTAKVYAMVSNVDANVGRVLAALDAEKLADNTIVIFLTDNGPHSARFNAGMRGYKGTVYEGGIHVPCYVRWPSHLRAGLVVEPIAAHIDLLPTLVDAAGLKLPGDLKVDGKSLLPLLEARPGVDWPDRKLFFQWHRGDAPEMGRAFAVRTERYKLVGPEPIPKPGQPKPDLPEPELYDLRTDPYETRNIADEHQEIAARLLDNYRAWFRDVSATRGFDPPRIQIGTAHENPTVLTRQDWRGPHANWKQDGFGVWEIEAPQAGTYDVSIRHTPRPEPAEAHLALGPVNVEQKTDPGSQICTFRAVEIPSGKFQLEAWLGNDKNKTGGGVQDVSVRRVDPVRPD
jgi:arylsulfatase A-like enzyme